MRICGKDLIPNYDYYYYSNAHAIYFGVDPFPCHLSLLKYTWMLSIAEKFFKNIQIQGKPCGKFKRSKNIKYVRRHLNATSIKVG